MTRGGRSDGDLLPRAINIRLTGPVAAGVESYRRAVTPIPTVSEAIRRLLGVGLRASGFAVPAPNTAQTRAPAQRTAPKGSADGAGRYALTR